MAHLIFLTSTPPSVAAGSGTWVGISVLREALLRLGHEVTLLAPDANGGKNTFSRIRFNFETRRTLRRMRADALVGFDLDGFLAGRRLLHVASIKGVLADEARHESGASRLALACQARLEAAHLRIADRVITTSDYSSRQIASLYGVPLEKISVVPEPINLVSWDRLLGEAAAVNGPLRILCVAHLYPRKGVDTLIRAFATIPAKAVLRIVGDGPERARLERLATDLGVLRRTSFLGNISRRELASEYRNASLFALPTTQEGFGIVFLEAMASSLPIVAGRAAAVPEVVADGVTGVLADPEDVQAVAKALVTLVERPELRATMGKAGRETVVRYDAPRVARLFLDAIGIG